MYVRKCNVFFKSAVWQIVLKPGWKVERTNTNNFLAGNIWPTGYLWAKGRFNTDTLQMY